MKLLMIIAAICVATGGVNAMAPDTIVVMTGDSIQDAIDIADPGDTIEVRKGIYVENLYIEVPGLTLKSKGAIIDGAYENPCISVDADGVTIEGFQLINGTAGVYACDLRSDLVGPRDVPIKPMQAHGLKVLDNKIYAAIPLGGILIHGYDARIEDNLVVGAAGYGIYYRVWGKGAPEPPTSRTFIRDNIVRHTKFAPLVAGDWDQPDLLPAGNGIDAAGGRLDIVDNHSEGNEFAGITIRVLGEPVDGFDGSHYTRVIGNIAHYNGAEIGGMCFDDGPSLDPYYMNEDGIWIEDRYGLGTLVEKNLTHKNGDDGIDLIGYAFDVIGNKATWNNDDGIEGEVGDSLFDKNVTWFNFDDGIVGRPYEDDSDDDPGDGNRITNNTSFNNSDEGIQFSGSYNYIGKNKANGNVQNGILVLWGDHVTIEGNTADKNGHQGISNSGWMTDIMSNKAKRNGYSLGPDIAGQGDGGGVVDLWTGNQFGSGGQFAQDRCVDPMYDG